MGRRPFPKRQGARRRLEPGPPGVAHNVSGGTASGPLTPSLQGPQSIAGLDLGPAHRPSSTEPNTAAPGPTQRSRTHTTSLILSPRRGAELRAVSTNQPLEWRGRAEALTNHSLAIRVGGPGVFSSGRTPVHVSPGRCLCSRSEQRWLV